MQYSTVFVVGWDQYGEFGEGNEYNTIVNELRKVKWHQERIIRKIVSGCDWSIYLNHNNEIYTAGHNQNGSCGVGKEDNMITTLSKVNSSKIKRIWTSPRSRNWFFEDDKNKIFAVGLNRYGELGIGETNKRVFPSLVQYFQATQNVKDIQCGSWHTVVLMNDGSVYSAAYNMSVKWATEHFKGQNGHGMSNHGLTPNAFHRIQCFSNTKIKEISAGGWFTLFLDINGSVYSCGHNYDGALGHGHTKEFGHKIRFGVPFQWGLPAMIQYFSQNNIVISTIRTGCQCSFAISNNGECYAFGNNSYGECGIPEAVANDPYCRISTPKKIIFPSPEIIVEMQCGAGHSMVIAKSKNYYFFGHNGYGQCLAASKKTRGDNQEYHEKPICVNAILSKICKDYTTDIVDISLGWHNTKIIVKNAQKIVDDIHENKTEEKSDKVEEKQDESNDDEKKNEENDDSKKELCVVCMDQSVKSVIVPCGHACVCGNKQCQSSLSSKCPICRGPIDMIIPLFISGI